MKEKLIRVAVYGTQMAGQRNERLGADARSRVPCMIRGVLYDTGWGFPAFVHDGPDVVKAKFVVLPVADWPAIDRLESYPTLYGRQVVDATLGSGTVEQVWVYVMRQMPVVAQAIPDGDWRNQRLTLKQIPHVIFKNPFNGYYKALQNHINTNKRQQSNRKQSYIVAYRQKNLIV